MGIKSLSNSSGIVNFQKHQSMLAGIELNKFHHLETVRLGSSVASVEFTNLGQYSDYQHLQIRMVSNASTLQNQFLQINGDTGTNYKSHFLYGDGSSVGSGVYSDNSKIYIGNSPNATSQFAGLIIDILDPFETTKNTTLRILYGSSGSYSVVQFMSGVWLNSAAVTSILIDQASGNYLAGSRFSLYGLKVGA